MLLRKGLFTRLDNSGYENSDDCVTLWRKVLDEMLIGMVGTNTSAAEHSMRWFNSRPGDMDFYIDDSDGLEYQVDAYESFCECCALANLDPEMVRETANKVYKIIKEEDAA